MVGYKKFKGNPNFEVKEGIFWVITEDGNLLYQDIDGQWWRGGNNLMLKAFNCRQEAMDNLKKIYQKWRPDIGKLKTVAIKIDGVKPNSSHY